MTTKLHLDDIRNYITTNYYFTRKNIFINVQNKMLEILHLGKASGFSDLLQDNIHEILDHWNLTRRTHKVKLTSSV